MNAVPPPRRITPALLLTLALLGALAPFATDLYLPSFPEMTAELGASATAVQLTLTACLVGIALGQLVFGPLSDRIGRMRPLLVGSALCVVASIVAALAPSIEVLTVARFVQGFAGAAGMVIGRAIVSDMSKPDSAARSFSLLMLVGGIAPVVAPFIGSLLVGPVGWRGILWTLVGLATLMFVAILAVVRETHPVGERAQRAARPSSRADLLGRRFLGHALAFAFGFAVLMSYISASPFVYQVMLGFSPVQYGMTFGLNALGLTAMSALSARLATRVPPRRTLGIGLGLVLAAALGLGVVVLTGAPHALIPVCIFVAVSSLGLVMGNATALALGAVPHASGTASAILGALQFGLGALVSPLVGLGGEHTAGPLAIVMISVAVIAGIAYLIAGVRPRGAEQTR